MMFAITQVKKFLEEQRYISKKQFAKIHKRKKGKKKKKK